MGFYPKSINNLLMPHALFENILFRNGLHLCVMLCDAYFL